MQKLKSYILAFYALLFFGFGLAALFTPDFMSSLVHISLNNAIANMEYMASYGGLFIGLALFMVYCLPRNTDLGLICVLFTMGGLFLARMAGYLVYQELDALQIIYLAGELFTLLLIPFLVFKTKKNPR